MLEFVVYQLRQRGALPAVQFGPLLAAEGAQPGEVLDTGAHLEKLKSESLMFDAACDSDSRLGHGAPVENLQEPQYARGERKANTIFRLVFA